jgi:hypothetical protein
MPLLVRHLVDNAIPGIASIVDNDVDFATSELSSLGDECLDVGIVEHVACNSQGAASRLVDL